METCNLYVILRSDLFAFCADSFEQFQTVQNTSYGVLKGGVPQSIELKKNAACLSVNTQLANNQPNAVDSDVANQTASANAEPTYDELDF